MSATQRQTVNRQDPQAASPSKPYALKPASVADGEATKVLRMQQTLGNQAVQHRLRSELNVSPHADQYEQQRDGEKEEENREPAEASVQLAETPSVPPAQESPPAEQETSPQAETVPGSETSNSSPAIGSESNEVSETEIPAEPSTGRESQGEVSPSESEATGPGTTIAPTSTEASAESPAEASPEASETAVPDQSPSIEPETVGPGTEASPGTETAPTSAEASETAVPDQSPSTVIVVEDSASELIPGQMRRSKFLSELEAAVRSTAEASLSVTGQSANGCPYIDYWFSYYKTQDSEHIGRAILKYVPESSSAVSAVDVISLISARVRRAVALWVKNGRSTGVPEEALALMSEERSAVGVGGSDSKTGSLLFKGREGGARDGSDPRAIQAELGSGHPLDSSVRLRMESAFSTDFSDVRMHADSQAGGLSSQQNARAFTVGEHIAFGAGEYRPGTLIGDALIAHELAHVVQQRGAGDRTAPMPKGEGGYSSLEEDADRSAVGAVVSLWGKAKDGLANVSENAMPRLRSGLRLSRCKNDPAAPPEVKPPAGTSTIKSKTVATTPADRTRTKLGIGEEVDLSLDPAAAAAWSVTGGGAVTPVAGQTTRFTASHSPSTPKVTATLPSETVTLDFEVIAPTGMKSTLNRDTPPGTAGPPNRQIGANSVFDCFVQPTTVSFYRARFRENIPGEAYTWPDGTAGSRPATTVAWTPNQSNKTTDDVNSALDPIARLKRGGAFVDFTYSVRVPEQYKNEAGTWVSWLPNEDHPREYKGSNQKCRVSVIADNTERGGWQGPFQ